MTERVDVAIVGGAVMGSATAYFLKEQFGFAGGVMVIERDPSYADAASARSTSGFRQQFSTPVNIALSRASAAFLLQANGLLGDDGAPAGIPISEAGYLYLGRTEHVAGFEANHALQRAHGVDVALLGTAELSARFPWLNVEDVAVGSLGLSGEGWFDGYLLMCAFARRARAAGAEYRAGRVLGLAREEAGFRLTLADGGTIEAARLILTAGTGTPRLAAMLGVAMPVTPAKQTVFRFDSPLDAPGMPYLFTPDGLFCRPEGAGFIAGIAIDDAEAAEDDLEAEHLLFDTELWPRLAYRARGFEQARFRGAWAGHYDMSRFDHNPFVGPVTAVPGLLVACGFSGHGMMQSPGIGRALAEQIMFGEYRALDLAALGFDRIARDERVFERIQY